MTMNAFARIFCASPFWGAVGRTPRAGFAQSLSGCSKAAITDGSEASAAVQHPVLGWLWGALCQRYLQVEMSCKSCGLTVMVPVLLLSSISWDEGHCLIQVHTGTRFGSLAWVPLTWNMSCSFCQIRRALESPELLHISWAAFQKALSVLALFRTKSLSWGPLRNPETAAGCHSDITTMDSLRSPCPPSILPEQQLPNSHKFGNGPSQSTAQLQVTVLYVRCHPLHPRGMWMGWVV